MTLWVIRPSSPLTNPLSCGRRRFAPKHNTARRGGSKAGAGSIPVRPTMGVGCERHTLAGSGQVIPASGERWEYNTQPQLVCGSTCSKGPSTLPASPPAHC